MVASGIFDVVLGSRILGSTALRGGMPLYKYVANRILTLFQNLMLSAKLSEYHTGYRAFSRRVLDTLPLLANSDDFLFDNQMLTQAIAFGFPIGEISCPTKYFPEASSINFRRSVVYGFGVLATSVLYRLWCWRLVKTRLFSDRPTLRLGSRYYHQDERRADPRPARGSNGMRMVESRMAGRWNSIIRLKVRVLADWTVSLLGLDTTRQGWWGFPPQSLRKPTVADWAQWCPPDQPRFLELQLLHYAPAAQQKHPRAAGQRASPSRAVQVLAVVEVAVHPRIWRSSMLLVQCPLLPQRSSTKPQGYTPMSMMSHNTSSFSPYDAPGANARSRTPLRRSVEPTYRCSPRSWSCGG